MSTQPESALKLFADAMSAGDIETVDLTHALDPDFPVIILPPEFGQCAPFRVEEISRYDERGPAWYWRNFSCGEHTGTHFDAPIHWVTGKDHPNATVDTIPADAFVRSVCVIDVSRQCSEDEDYLMTVEDIEAWEKENGKIPAGDWVLLRSDWSRRSGAEYLNFREDGAHSPGPSAEAVKFLIEERDIVGFGTETVGTDAGQAHNLSPQYPAHSLFHGANKYGLQCLSSLDRLPPTGAVLVCPPLKIKGGSGSPLRVLALVDRTAA